jgi:hypothetical protein
MHEIKGIRMNCIFLAGGYARSLIRKNYPFIVVSSGMSLERKER